MFPYMTKEKQQFFETYCTKNNIAGSEDACHVPCICGCYGRACRQMNDAANRRLCSHCALRIFVSTVETITEVCDEKESIGISHLYDSDIYDIQNRLKENVTDVEYSYIEDVLDCLVTLSDDKEK